MKEHPTVTEVIRTVTTIAKPPDETDNKAMLTYTSMRNQLSSQYLTSPHVADFPLSVTTLRMIGSTLERFRSNTAIQVNAALHYLDTLDVAQPSRSTVQHLHHRALAAFRSVMSWYKSPTREETAMEEAPITQATLEV